MLFTAQSHSLKLTLVTRWSYRIIVFPIHCAAFEPTEQANCHKRILWSFFFFFYYIHIFPTSKTIIFHHATCTPSIPLLNSGWTIDMDQISHQRNLLRNLRGSQTLWAPVDGWGLTAEQHQCGMTCRKWKFSLPHRKARVQGFDFLLEFIIFHTQIKVYHQIPFPEKRWRESVWLLYTTKKKKKRDVVCNNTVFFFFF